VKILFIIGQPYSTRNDTILRGLRENGIEIIECTNLSKSYFLRYPNVLGKFIFRRKEEFDLIFVGFFGQPLVPIIKKLSNRPIIFDAFLSAYDTMCFDRKKFRPNSLVGRFFYWLDKHSCELADKILLDTNAHINYFVETFGLEREKLQKVFVSANDSIFYPRPAMKDENKFNVFYYGSYIPAQGIDYIIKAAKKLEPYEDIEFKIIGKGMEHKKIIKLRQDLNIKNIKFEDWVPYEELPLEIAKADVCLGGHFSSIDKAKRVISGKTFHFIAMKKPVIIGDNLANKELFENKKNALFVEHANADALADAILELKNDESLREKIAEEGYRTFKERCTPKIIGKEIKEIIEEALDKRG
jgi:glycosyltransferase involved in cell wall biosynthesis